MVLDVTDMNSGWPGDHFSPAVRTVLDDLLKGADDWGASRLCMTGSPLEQTFTSADTEMRLTLEVSDPSDDPALRLGKARAIATELGAALDEQCDAIERVQRDSPLKYGAWLGLRDEKGVAQPKLYLEVPEGGSDQALDLLSGGIPDIAEMTNLPGRIHMVGIAPDGVIEIYAGCRDIRPATLSDILDRAGQGGQGGLVLDILCDLTCQMSRARVPIRDVGYSFRYGKPGDPLVPTIYGTAFALFGNDRVARDRLAEMASQLGGDFSHARAFADKLPATGPRILHHGMVGVSLIPSHAPVLSCGIGSALNVSV